MPGDPRFDPNLMALRGRIGAHVSHARHDPRDTTANARRAFQNAFLEAADPDHVLPEAERARRADHLRRAHYARLALKSAEARRHRPGAGRVAPSRVAPRPSTSSESDLRGASSDDEGADTGRSGLLHDPTEGAR